MGLKNLPESYCLIFSLMSLGGVPPFLGFLSKVLVLKRAFSLVNISFLIILALASLNILVFYMRLVISASLISPSVKIQIKGPGLSHRLYVHISIIFIFNIAVLLLI
jgi:NADH:ubiquinone oxidoreductase subunit 2 (subunit N)